MTNIEPGIRNGVRAVIVRERQLLLLRKAYEDGSERYVLPGGAQDQGETLTEALQRECREEIDTEVMVSGLLYLADYFKPRETVPPTPGSSFEAAGYTFTFREVTESTRPNGDVDTIAVFDLADLSAPPKPIDAPELDFGDAMGDAMGDAIGDALDVGPEAISEQCAFGPIAGLGVAFHAKPMVKEHARHAISTLGLDGILYLLPDRSKPPAPGTHGVMYIIQGADLTGHITNDFLA